MSGLDAGRPAAVVVARGGRLPVGGDEAVAEAGGLVVVVGSGTNEAARSLATAERAWFCETGPGLQPGALAATLAPLLHDVPLVVMPSSPDGRDLAPRVAAILDRPFIAHAVSVSFRPGPGPDGRNGNNEHRGGVDAEVSRLDDRILVTITVDGPAVATLVPGSRSVVPRRQSSPWEPEPVTLSGPSPEGAPGSGPLDPQVLEILEPDPATMDLADAVRVLGGGAGLAAGTSDDRARATFDLLVQVSAALGASAGATRVVTDAGWIGYERQIGTTGVTVDPDLYIALGVSGATQHVGGLGAPRHVVSVNTDPSCPMTAMADLGLITDGRGLLIELARRLNVVIPTGVLTGHGPGDIEGGHG